MSLDTILKEINNVIEVTRTQENEEILITIPKCRKAYIDYDNGKEYTLTNPFSITVTRNKAGLIDIEYCIKKVITKETEYGEVTEDIIENHVVENSRVTSLEVEFHQNPNKVKTRTLYTF